jgi:H+/gluconate symporter-like permease
MDWRNNIMDWAITLLLIILGFPISCAIGIVIVLIIFRIITD